MIKNHQTAHLSYYAATKDPNLFGPWFSGPSWSVWDVVAKAAFGEALSGGELITFKRLTGLDVPPASPVKELWLLFGRRSGKDVRAASICAYLATIGAARYGLTRRLVRGERGVVQLLAVDRNQSAVVMGYLQAMFMQPMLRKLVMSADKETIELRNGLAIEITTNDARRVRGRTVIAAVFDEVAHWRNENSVNPDHEVYGAVMPGMSTVDGAMLIAISSVHAKRGLLYDRFVECHGKPGLILVARAPTWLMNPTLKRADEDPNGPIAQAYRRDSALAAAEYGSEFRADISGFVDRSILDAATDRGVYERPPQDGATYFGFCDPSGGAVSGDAFTLGIARFEPKTNKAVLDCLREQRAPFDPAIVAGQMAKTLRVYGLDHVTGDRYASGFTISAFGAHGIDYRQSALTRSEIYLECLPGLMAGQIRLLDSERLIQQFTNLERKATATGRDLIDHPRGGNDDVCNSAAGALMLALSEGASTAARTSDPDGGVMKFAFGPTGFRLVAGRSSRTGLGRPLKYRR